MTIYTKLPGDETELQTLVDGDASGAAAAVTGPLPQLPTPDHASRFRQWSTGCGGVLCAIVGLLPTSAWAIFYIRVVPSHQAVVLVILGSIEAIVALVCLVGLYTSDSELIILRDPSQPMPDQVVIALSEAAPLPAWNINDEHRGSFCVRCLVWRPTGVPKRRPSRSWHHLIDLC